MIVNTEFGKIEGLTSEAGYSFLGVPFAAPPVDELRFKPPQLPSRWSGVRRCQEYSAIAPQPHLGNITPLKLRNPQSEDCLYLNIFAPHNARNLPVMFWLYGGGFVAGTANMPTYNGINLASEQNVIVVTINYRVGILGFCGENFGLMDQVAGLNWVKNNIVSFGGDPNNITVFGESAGASSIDALMREPAAAGLFQRAICQSGTLDTVKVIFASSGKLNITKNADIDDLLAEQSITFGWDDDKYVCQPRECGEKYWNPVPLLIGWNNNEETIFTGNCNPEDFERWSERMFNAEFTRAVMARYEDPKTAWNAVIRYAGFALPARTMAEKIATLDQPVYFYRFKREAPEVRYAKHLKCYHSSEISYVFGNALTPPSAEDQLLSKQMMSYWTNFARTGDPNDSALPKWPQWHANERRNIILDVPISSESDCAKTECDFFASLGQR